MVLVKKSQNMPIITSVWYILPPWHVKCKVTPRIVDFVCVVYIEVGVGWRRDKDSRGICDLQIIRSSVHVRFCCFFSLFLQNDGLVYLASYSKSTTTTNGYLFYCAVCLLHKMFVRFFFSLLLCSLLLFVYNWLKKEFRKKK